MKILVGIFFLVASHASKNIELKNLLLGDDRTVNDVAVIKFHNLERQKENLPNFNEEIKIGEVLIDHKSLASVQKDQSMTLETIFKSQHLVRKVLSFLETDADQIHILNTWFTDVILRLYKESIRKYPSESEIYSFDQILCLSANEFMFQKAFRKEIAENKPEFFTQIHDQVKSKVQKIPDCDEYKLYTWNFNKVLDKTSPMLQKYEKLTNERLRPDIINAALQKVNGYNRTHQKAKSLIKKTNMYVAAVFLAIFALYVAFLILPFQSNARKHVHEHLAIISFMSSCFIQPFLLLCDFENEFWEQVHDIFAILHLVFGFVTGIFNLAHTFHYSFVAYVLMAIFIGSFYFLPIVLVLLHAAYRDYISPKVLPNEIRKAKKTIRNIKRFFFVAD